jgi:hypothetical protein
MGAVADGSWRFDTYTFLICLLCLFFLFFFSFSTDDTHERRIATSTFRTIEDCRPWRRWKTKLPTRGRGGLEKEGHGWRRMYLYDALEM